MSSMAESEVSSNISLVVCGFMYMTGELFYAQHISSDHNEKKAIQI